MATPAAPEKPVETPEQIAAAAEAAKIASTPREVVEEFLSGAAGKPLEKPADAKPEKAPAKPAAKPPAKPAAAKPAQKPTRTPAPAPALDVAELASEVGKSVAREVLAARAPEKPAPVVGEFDGLTDVEKRQVPIMERMELKYPDRYKGLKDKYVANAKAVNEYTAKWEDENPGKEFHPEDHDHDAFFAKHSVDWDDEDASEARAEIIADSRIAEATARTNAELEQFRNKERVREQAPAIESESRAVDKKVWDIIGGDFSKLVKEDGTVDTEAVKKVRAEDPIGAEIALPQVANLNAHFQELIRLDRGLVKLDKNNPMHGFIVKFAVDQENAILALPKDKQVDSTGKKYAKSVDYQAMTPQQRTKHWTLGASELNRLMAAEYGTGIKKQIEVERARIERLSAQLGYVKGDKPKPAAAPDAGKPAEEHAPEPEEEIESPETTPVRTGRPGELPAKPSAKDGVAAFFGKDW